MLSCVLRSERAVQVNVAIMRAFVRLRRLMLDHEELARKLTAIERKHDAQFKVFSTPFASSLSLHGRPSAVSASSQTTTDPT